MSLSSNTKVRRCRPLLGTYVEISVWGWDETKLHSAVNAAFAAIERTQTLLSAHDANSELSLLNREAALYPVTVSRETLAVLRRAHKLASESDGAFDYTVAPLLARWGFLPAGLRRRKPGTWRDVLLLPERKVCFLQPLALDLGGIAKGFAVDAATRILRRHGVENAMVNAGGDLRVFGDRPATICLRHPTRPYLVAEKIRICNSAVATSSPCFTERNWRGRPVSHLVDSLRRTAITGARSVSVCARECWLADALTKIVFNTPRRAQDLLAHYQAEAFVITA